MWQRDDVRQAMRGAEDALARLRFHEGLRRGWHEARAEAAVREAAALARLEGVRIDVAELRHLSVGDGLAAPERRGTGDAARDLALGIWRAEWNVASGLADLNTSPPVRRRSRPAPALLTALHRDACSALLASGRVAARQVAMPVEPDRLRRVLALLGTGPSARGASVPAMVAAAAVIAEFRAGDVFTPASLAVGGAAARWLLVERGVDPTGVAVPSLLDAEDPAGAGRALGGWVRGIDEGDTGRQAAWITRVARGIERGAREGEDIALRVQAGRLG